MVQNDLFETVAKGEHLRIIANRYNHQQARSGEKGGTVIADRKRPPIVIWIIPLMIGLAGFSRVAQSPSFAMYRTVDIVQFLGSGACFGAVMVGVPLSIFRRS